jgi:hypothetical protein
MSNQVRFYWKLNTELTEEVKWGLKSKEKPGEKRNIKLKRMAQQQSEQRGRETEDTQWK